MAAFFGLPLAHTGLGRSLFFPLALWQGGDVVPYSLARSELVGSRYPSQDWLDRLFEVFVGSDYVVGHRVR